MKTFLKDNFALIKQALEETWKGQGAQLESIQFHDNEKVEEMESLTGIRVEAIIKNETTKEDEKFIFIYREENHNKENFDESVKSFLDDLNTDVVMADIGMKYPQLNIASTSWPDGQIILRNDKVIKGLSEFFNPSSGEFNIALFLKKKNGEQSYLARSGFVAISATEKLPQNYQSELAIKPEVLKKFSMQLQ